MGQAGLPVEPVARVLSREVDQARQGSSRRLSVQEAAFVAVAGVLVVVLSVMGHAMYAAKYSTMETPDFSRYHPGVPWVILAMNALYVAALRTKGVAYWLAYFPAVIAMVMAVLLLGLIHGRVEPGSLRGFDFGWDWWRGA